MRYVEDLLADIKADSKCLMRLPYTFLGIVAVMLVAVNPRLARANGSVDSKPTIFAAGKGLILDDRLLDLPVPQGAVAMNGSIVDLDGRYFVAYRSDTQTQNTGPSSAILLTELDATFSPMGAPVRLETPCDVSGRGSAEDPRLVAHQGHLWVVYNDLMPGRRERRMMIAEIELDDSEQSTKFILVRRKALGISGFQLNEVEKNWTPFVSNNEINLIYQTNPPIVARLAADAWAADGTEVSLERVTKETTPVASPLGTMRGGTPGYYLKHHDAYLSFYHTFMLIGAQRTYAEMRMNQPLTDFAALYMMGAYLFDAQAPFNIRALTYAPMVPPSSYEDEEFYGGLLPQKKGWITYPTGLVIDYDQHRLYVSYSQNDRRTRLVTLDLRVLDKQWITPAAVDDVSR